MLQLSAYLHFAHNMHIIALIAWVGNKGCADCADAKLKLGGIFMGQLGNSVRGFLGETNIWVFATCGDKPNVGPIFFKKIDEQGNIVLFDVFMKKNLQNLVNNQNVALTVFNAQTLQGYQIKGTATYSTDDALIKAGNEQTSKMNLPTKGAVIINIEEVYVQTPGPDVGKIL